MTITFPTDTADIIDAIRTAIGRPTYWYTENTSTACPVCTLDPVTNLSTNAFCNICNGAYWIKTYTTNTISGHVTWAFSEQLGWQTGGQMMEGDCRVQIDYTLENVTIVDTAVKVEVDGKDMQVIKKTLRGVPQINRVLVDLKERNKE
jgi:hypothetical protein